MDWLILLVLVPALVVPVVLLWGFCGCSLLFVSGPEEPPLTRAFEGTLTPGASEVDLRGCCLVQRIGPARLQAGGASAQITLRGPSASALTVDRVYISRVAGAGSDFYDSTADDLTLVAEDVVLPADQSVTLDEVSYALDPGQPLLIAFDLNEDFAFGARVRVVLGQPDELGVREGSPGGTQIGTQPVGAAGTIVNGPMTVSGRKWYEVDFEPKADGSEVDGWVPERQTSGVGGERFLAFAGDVYLETILNTDARTFHRVDVAEAGIADREAGYTSEASIYLVERIEARP